MDAPIAGEIVAPLQVRRETSVSGQLLLMSLLLAMTGVGVLVSWLMRASFLVGVLAGSASFLFYRRVLVPQLLLAAERNGIAAMQRSRYDEALACFLRSETFFAQHRWLDRWRGLIDASRHRHELLARYNRAACLARRGETARAVELLQSIVKEAPELELAVNLLGQLTR